MADGKNGVMGHWLFLLVSIPLGAVVRAFVLMNLWNWFVTAVFQVSDISFWNVFGISLIIGMFSSEHKKVAQEERKWSRLTMMVNYCVPEERRPEMMEALKTEFADTELQSLGYSTIGSLVGYAITLGIGFVVHLLAA